MPEPTLKNRLRMSREIEASENAQARDAARWREVEPLLREWLEAGQAWRVAAPGSLSRSAQANGALEKWIRDNVT